MHQHRILSLLQHLPRGLPIRRTYVTDDDGGASGEGSGSDAEERSGDEGGDDGDRRRSGSGTDAAARTRRINAGTQNPMEAGTDVRQRTKIKRPHRKGHGIGAVELCANCAL